MNSCSHAYLRHFSSRNQKIGRHQSWRIITVFTDCLLTRAFFCRLWPGDYTCFSIESQILATFKLPTEAHDMKGYVTNIESDTLKNKDFRRVLYTAKNSQLVLMSLRPKEDIGEETHTLDQFIRVEAGRGFAILDGIRHNISDGFAIVIPSGTKHNIINDSDADDLKLYTLYSPPEHRDKTIHPTKAAAVSHEEHFDGRTTE
jgi:mannose-6-phosphate isomerase-like protein (cupin superfamily)